MSSKSLYLAGFSRYKHFYALQFLRKIRKFKMATTYFRENFFEKIGMATLQRYPVGQKFRRNLYRAGFSRYKHFYILQFL